MSDTRSTFVSCWSLTSCQNLRSYQEGYQLVTVHTHDDFIALSHWETRPPAPWPGITLSYIILTLSQPVLDNEWANQSFPYPNNAERLARKQQVSIFKSSAWLNREPNARYPTCRRHQELGWQWSGWVSGSYTLSACASYLQLELGQDVSGQDECQVEQLTGGLVELQPAGVVVGSAQPVPQRPRSV